MNQAVRKDGFFHNCGSGLSVSCACGILNAAIAAILLREETGKEMDRYFACFGLKGSLVLTCLMSLYALALAVCFPSPVRWLCAAAMLLSSCGDIFLMHFPAIERRFSQWFMIGAGFFMAAHVLYAACYAIKIHNSGAQVFNPGAMTMLVIAAATAVWFVIAACAKGKADRLPLILVYIAMISLGCTMIFSYAWSQGIRNPLAILAAVGAVSFFLSDLIIGLDIVFDGSGLGYLIWWLYPIGQFLMILGIGRG